MSTHLAWLRVGHFRDVRPNTTLRFNPGWNVLLGRNATGKTTLLNLLSCVLRSDFTLLREEAFEIEFALVSDTATVTAWLQHSPGAELSADPTYPSDAGWTLAYRVTLEVEGVPQVVVSSDGRIAHVRAGAGSAAQTSVARIVDAPFLLRTAVHIDFARRANLALASASTYRFDEALETFYAVVGDDRAGREACTATPARLSLGPSRGVGQLRAVRLSFFPSALVQSVPDGVVQEAVTVDDTTLGASPSLAALPGLLGFARMTTTLAVLDSHDEEGRRWFNLGKLAFSFYRADGTMLRHDRLSFGQKRLLAFFYYLDANPHFVVADELVNGMHHAWIDDCLRAMEGRQVFVTAQNPLLLDHLHFERPEDVTRRFVLCRVNPREGGGRETLWEHPTEAQGEEIQRAYDNGVLRVHEILRYEQLW